VATVLRNGDEIGEPDSSPSGAHGIGNTEFECADCSCKDLATDVHDRETSGVGVPDVANEPLLSVAPPRFVGCNLALAEEQPPQS